MDMIQFNSVSLIKMISVLTMQNRDISKKLMSLLRKNWLNLEILMVDFEYRVNEVAGGVTQYSSFTGYAHLAAGLACGLSGMAAGIAIGIVGDCLTRASAEQPKLFVGMVLILIFAEALGLYGLIVGLILASKA